MLSYRDMQKSQLPDDPQELNQLYDETVEAHRAYLEKVHNAFDRRCEEIRQRAHEKLKPLAESDEEGKKRVVQEEKMELDQVLSELKMAIHQSSQDARLKLEEIQSKMESSAADLDRELTSV